MLLEVRICICIENTFWIKVFVFCILYFQSICVCFSKYLTPSLLATIAKVEGFLAHSSKLLELFTLIMWIFQE